MNTREDRGDRSCVYRKAAEHGRVHAFYVLLKSVKIRHDPRKVVARRLTIGALLPPGMLAPSHLNI